MYVVCACFYTYTCICASVCAYMCTCLCVSVCANMRTYVCITGTSHKLLEKKCRRVSLKYFYRLFLF